MTETFGTRLAAAMRTHGPLCTGIDPHPGLLLDWDLPISVEGLRRFAGTCVEAFAGRVAIVKPQSAFFEAFGSAGVAVLEQTLSDLRAAGTLTLLDVKRGDIGSTMAAYAAAYLDPDAPLATDAITVSPFLGFDSLAPAYELAREHGRGLFVLALTSNPGGDTVQHAQRGEHSVAAEIVEQVTRLNHREDHAALGSFGLVVGATMGAAIAELDLGPALLASRAPLLAPGFGAQGATVGDLRSAFGPAASQVVVASSREVLAGGPSVAGLQRVLAQTQAAVAELGDASLGSPEQDVTGLS